MTEPESIPSRTSHPRRATRVALIALAVGVFLSQWVRILLRPEGDFYLHWIFGQRFRFGGFLYAAGMHRPYPPFWGLASVPLTLLPMPLMRALLYPFGLVPLAALLIMLHALTSRQLTVARGRYFGLNALALILASRFVIRELPECGANLMIVALTWGSVYSWSRRRDTLGGISLGLAIALKCTPALFLLYYAWKRQWRIAVTGATAALMFTLSPILWIGSASYAHHMRYWLGTVRKGLTETHPLRGVLGDEEPYNLALKPAIGRYLVHLPPTHGGYRWRLDLLDLDPVLAGWIVKGATAALLVAVAGILTRRIGRRDSLAVVWEASAVLILMLLLSPITWRQHCVAVLPACYLLARTALVQGLPRWMVRLISAYAVMVIVLDRGIIGPTLTLKLDSHGITAMALLILLTVTLGGRARALAEERAEIPGRIDAGTAPRPGHLPLESQTRVQP